MLEKSVIVCIAVFVLISYPMFSMAGEPGQETDTSEQAHRPGSDVEIGVASWYGAWHQGRRTASGEDFDLNGMTAAHRTLPMNTRITVTNLQNGKSVSVRINDRGPYLEGRDLDLSERAADEIGMKKSGLAPVEIAILR